MGLPNVLFETRWISVCAVILFCATLPCRAEGPGMETMEKERGKGEVTVAVSMADKGKQVDMKKGDVLEIELQTHATAGYSWYFEGLDEDRLKIISKEARVLSHRMGAPVSATWQLMARKTGPVKIDMYNYRIWEGREKAVNHFSLEVRID